MTIYNYRIDEPHTDQTLKQAMTIQDDTGTLTIAMHPGMRANAKELVAYAMNGFPGSDTETKQKPDAWAKANEYLLGLAARIMESEFGRELFKYLPLTKAGKFPKRKSILLADTDCRATYVGTGFVRPMKLQLRLVPFHADTAEFIRNTTHDDVMQLLIDVFDTGKNAVPVFDGEGNPAKPETKKTSYLHDACVQQGYLYEEKSGTRFLCLAGARVDYEIHSKKNGMDVVIARGSAMRPDDEQHYYLKWSKALEKLFPGETTLFEIIKELAIHDPPGNALTTVSMRSSPRKFVRRIRLVYDPAKTHTDTISGYKGVTLHTEYTIHAPNDGPQRNGK